MPGAIGDHTPDLTTSYTFQSANAANVVQSAQLLVTDQGGLTTSEKAELEQEVTLLINSPSLPAPDKEALTKWKAKLDQVPTSAAQDSTIDLFNPKLLSDLLSSDPGVVNSAFDVLGGVGNVTLTPQVKEILQAGIGKMAQEISQIHSTDPQEVKQQLQALFKQALKGMTDKDGKPLSDAEINDVLKQLSGVIDEAATNISVLNLANQNTLINSTDPKAIYQVLLTDSNLSSLPPSASIQASLTSLADKIANANLMGTPIAGLGSLDPHVVASTIQMLIDPTVTTPSALALSIGTSIATTNSSTVNAINNDPNFGAIMAAASLVGTLRTSGSGGSGNPPPLLLSHKPALNPYLTPGIMALLGPILTALTKIYTEMMRQSSLLRQKMIGLVSSMAQDAFNYAVGAGLAKAGQLQQDVTQAMASIIGSCITMASSFVQLGFTSKKMDGYDEANKDSFPDKLQEEYSNGTTKEEQTKFAQKYFNDDAFQTSRSDGTLKPDVETALKPDTNGKISQARFRDNLDQGRVDKGYQFSPERMSARNNFQQQAQAAIGSVGDFLGQTVTNAATVVTKTAQASLVLTETQDQGMSQLLGTMIQTVTDTMRTAGQEGDTAQKALESFQNLFTSMAQTVTSMVRH